MWSHLVRCLVLYTLNCKMQKFFIEFREETLSQQVSKFTKVYPQQTFSILNLFISFWIKMNTKIFFYCLFYL